MKLTQPGVLSRMLHSRFILILTLALSLSLVYLANQYFWQVDLTQNKRNSLSEQSIALLQQMAAPVEVIVFAAKDDVTNGDKFRQSMVDFIGRYQRVKPNISLSMLSVQENPSLAREENITVDGEMVVKYSQQSMHIVPPLNEERFTNLLLKLSRAESRHIGLVTSAQPFGQVTAGANNQLKKALSRQGYTIINIADRVQDYSEEKLGALILNDATPIDQNQATILSQYIAGGGNMLWLVGNHSHDNFAPIINQLGLKVIAKPLQQHSGDEVTGSEVYANYYAQHPITQQFSMKIAFSEVYAIDGKPAHNQGWEVRPLVLVASGQAQPPESVSDEGSAQETMPKTHQVALVYERKVKEKVQRIVVIGDTQFLSQRSLDKTANKQFLANIMQWLTFDAIKLAIKPKRLKDVNLIIPEQSALPKMIGYTVQYAIPLLMIILTFYIIHRRRKY